MKAVGSLSSFYSKISPTSQKRPTVDKSFDSLSTFKSFDDPRLNRGHRKRVSELSMPTSDCNALQEELPLSQLQRLCSLIESQSMYELSSEYRSLLEMFSETVLQKTSALQGLEEI